VRGVSGIAGLVRARIFELLRPNGSIAARLVSPPGLPDHIDFFSLAGDDVGSLTWADGGVNEVRATAVAPTQVGLEVANVVIQNDGGGANTRVTLRASGILSGTSSTVEVEPAEITLLSQGQARLRVQPGLIDLRAVDGGFVTIDVTPTAWTAVTFAANWQNFAGGFGPCRYRVWGNRVYLDGLARRINAATAGVSVVLASGLPAPTDTKVLITRATPSGTPAGGGAQRLDIQPDGDLVWTFEGANAAINHYVSLSGLSYPLD